MKSDHANRSWFAMKHPNSGAFVKKADIKGGNLYVYACLELCDCCGVRNLFYLSKKPYLWHTIYAEEPRWSYGAHLSNAGAQRVMELLRGQLVTLEEY